MPPHAECAGRNIADDRRLTKLASARYNGAMAARSLEIGPAGIRAARTIEILRTERGLAQRELAARVTALGRPMSNTMLSRIERAQRRCDIATTWSPSHRRCTCRSRPSSPAQRPPEPDSATALLRPE
ncbi:hypothetical protein GCM10010512_18720 [Streptomyces thermoviolaceus subsp. thermoviolaceus]|nr:hypothetical protein GCM10010512_18720 [Streptomyces thermoviolaceus subsp. thermoviolaceus]